MLATRAKPTPKRRTFGPAVIEWIEENCVLPTGEHIGEPFRLLPWQKEWILELYRADRADALQYKWALLGVPKGNGKALAVDTPIATPGGWTLMGDLHPGDRVFGDDGMPCRVTAVSGYMLERPCYRVTFSDGASIVADAEHQWATHALRTGSSRGTPATPQYQIRTTEQIAATLRMPVSSSAHPQARWNHRVAMAHALDLPPAELPIDPYVLGCWLGDGDSDCARLTVGAEDKEAMMANLAAVGTSAVGDGRRLRIGGVGVRGIGGAASLNAALRRAGLLRNKHVPAEYLRAAADQRMGLLQGLMDTDGHATANGRQCEFTTTRPAIRDGMLELLGTLGFKAVAKEHRAMLNGRDCGPKWRIMFTAYSDRPVFRLPRKATRLRPRPVTRPLSEGRMIVGCDPVPSVPVQCISVDSPSRLFLAGSGFVPTHNSPLAASLGLYHLLGDPEVTDPWVVVAAASDKQADIVFDAAKRMCEMSPTLNAATIRYRWEIQVKDGTGKLERVAASGGKLDGKIVSMLILDELHEWTLENWVVLTGGAMKRRGSQIIQITTAGWDQESICYREYAKGRALVGTENPSYFFQWFEAPADMDYRSPETWKLANPSWGELVHEEILTDLAINIPQSQFERYRLNRWVDSEDFWLPPGAWEACRDDTVALLPGVPTYVGWDASTTNDSTAVVLVQPQGEVLVGKARVWARPIRPDGNPDESWRLPIIEVEDYCRDICREYDVRSIAFDPAFITWSAADLEAEGLPMVKMPQSPARMCPATAALYEAIIQGRLRHDGDPVLTAHIKAAKVHHQRRGGDMLEKQRGGKKIDAAVALVMAVGEAVLAEDTPEINFY